MSDPSRQNSPSRKSRFRALGRGRPAAGEGDHPSGDEELSDELAAVDLEGNEDGANPRLPEPEAGWPGHGGLSAEDHSSDDDGIPAAMRLTRDPDEPTIRRGVSAASITGLSLAMLAAGGLIGYLFGSTHGKQVAMPSGWVDSTKRKPPLELTQAAQSAIDAAFDNTKHAKYDDARKQFEALFAQHPEWPSLEIEAARAALYARDFQGAQSLIAKATADRALADGALLTALLHLTAQEYDPADLAFASAVAIDPTRADIYYFWGENLRREGKPMLAAEKFKAALARNQYENVEPLYRLKYWITLIQAEQDVPSGEGAVIDADLASARPSSAALFAGAARAIKAADYKTAAALLTKAQAITDPTVFGVVMRDPTFVEANMQPELLKFFK